MFEVRLSLSPLCLQTHLSSSLSPASGSRNKPKMSALVHLEKIPPLQLKTPLVFVRLSPFLLPS